MPFSLFPKDDRRLATRLKRQLMGFTSYLMFLFPLAYEVRHGWLRCGYQGLALILLASVAINIGFFAAIRSGLTRRLADPSVMRAQIGMAGLMALVIGYFTAPEAMVVVLMLFFTSFFFGTFSFSKREYLALAAAAAFGYAAMLVLKYRDLPGTSAALGLERLHFVILIMVLLWMSLLGSYLSGLRLSLAQKKDALAAALARLKELASRDELTGLHNRRHLMEILEQQHERARRYSEPFALCILDLDLFKRVNDTYGHGVGDEALRGFSDRIRSNLRRMDVVSRGDIEFDSTFGRYGGEEFLLLLPYAKCDTALLCVNRLRAALHAKPLETSIGDLPMTFSAGISAYRSGESVVEMINRADEALYHAKHAGRDRVECEP